MLYSKEKADFVFQHESGDALRIPVDLRKVKSLHVPCSEKNVLCMCWTLYDALLKGIKSMEGSISSLSILRLGPGKSAKQQVFPAERCQTAPSCDRWTPTEDPAVGPPKIWKIMA